MALDLGHNGIGLAGAVLIAAGLRANGSLTELNLRHAPPRALPRRRHQHRPALGVFAWAFLCEPELDECPMT